MRRLVLLSALLAMSGCTSESPSRTSPAAEKTAEKTVAAPAPRPWDPRDVAELPRAGQEVLPGLPGEVRPPRRAPSLASRPMTSAVLGVQRLDDRILLLGADDSWRSVRPSEEHAHGTLSPDGTRLAILLSDRIELWDLPTSQRTEVPLPDGFRPWDFVRLGWIDDDTLLFDDRGGGWRIDIASGDAERTPDPRDFAWTVATDGDVVETSDPALSGISEPLQVQASADVVAGTAYGDGHDGALEVFAIDREDPEAVQRMPVRDFEANYSNWALRVAHVLDDGSVLLWVAVVGRRDVDGWRLVRWDPATERLAIVTCSRANPTWSLTFAGDLLE